MSKTIEFFYDCSSPWTYLAFSRIEEIAARHGARLVFKPFLVSGVFNAVNPSVYESRTKPVKPKSAYYTKDLIDWARFYGLRINPRPTVFPVNSVKAMRGAFVADEYGKIVPYSRRAFEAYWGEDRDIGQETVLASIAAETGLDPEDFLRKIAAPEYKQKLFANTNELIERGGFGSPTIFVNDSMFFGNDRLLLVEAELQH